MTDIVATPANINADAISLALRQHQQDILASLLVSAWMV
jgi:hypothetical protein